MSQPLNPHKITMEEMVSFTKSKGFVYPSSEIYGGFAATYDYGPLGVELLNNIKRMWWTDTVYGNLDIYGLDGAIFTNPKVWEASGHTAAFADPMFDCLHCQKRMRADHLVEEQRAGSADGLSLTQLDQARDEYHLHCSHCGSTDLSGAQNFNLLVAAELGTTHKEKVYLRGETCQTIYLNFLHVQQTERAKMPFGIAQIGKSFRNEITLKNFIFRTREFEQMELQYFCHPKQATDLFAIWRTKSWNFLTSKLGLAAENVRWRQHEETERAHYAVDAFDIEYHFPMGFRELEGVHNRGNWDLSRHSEYSGRDLAVTTEDGEKYLPFVIETSVGANRLFLALMFENYDREQVGEQERVVMRFTPELAPLKVMILPLMKKDGLRERAEEIAQSLQGQNVKLDITGSVGKRYRRADEIGVPVCVTIDYETLTEETVTVRDRDTMKQERIAVVKLATFLNKHYGWNFQ